MADSEDNKQSVNLESVEENPELNFFSDTFNPLLALSVSKLKVPDENAKVYDNIASYKSATDNLRTIRPKKVKDVPPAEIIRRWLPEQSR